MEPDQNVQRSFPLSVLFVLIAACAVVSALLAPAMRAIVTGQIGAMDAITASVGGAVCVMLIGAVVGLYHYRPLRGLAWGTLTGGVIGMFAGPIMLSPHEAFGSLMTMAIGGAVVLIVSGLAFGLAWKA